jgi:peptidoglycan biosynthesis protein MviN/MurJ (putative lipid II flippase)
LNPGNSFIWAFIAPIIAIILTNVGFLLMAIIVLWKQRKRRTGDMNAKQVGKWLKASASLLVVLGVPWIFGVLLVKMEELTPLAYVYTILVAFQGVFIFLILVLFSKQTRDEYVKWWNTVKKSEANDKR